MASINYAKGQIFAKIVYYGPSGSGKTANLQVIHRRTPPDQRNDMIPLAAEIDRTCFYDYLPLNIGKIKGFDLTFQIYTVPGLDAHDATRKLVLQGVDGIVFVADSAASKVEENAISFQNLETNLAAYGYAKELIPIYIQYNKRDLPDAVAVRELNDRINMRGLPFGEGIALRGIGVFDALKRVGREITDKLNQKNSSYA